MVTDLLHRLVLREPAMPDAVGEAAPAHQVEPAAPAAPAPKSRGKRRHRTRAAAPVKPPAASPAPAPRVPTFLRLDEEMVRAHLALSTEISAMLLMGRGADDRVQTFVRSTRGMVTEVAGAAFDRALPSRQVRIGAAFDPGNPELETERRQP